MLKFMQKQTQAGYSFLGRTNITEKLLCECYVLVSVAKWYGQIKVSSEMKALLLQLYRTIGSKESHINHNRRGGLTHSL